MLKLIRDSIFKPKNIIYYRAKKPWFVILYVLLLSILLGLAYFSKPISQRKLTVSEKITIVDAFSNTDAKIQNGAYTSTKNVEVIIKGYVFKFYKSVDDMNSDKDYVDISICGDSIYYCLSTFQNTKAFRKISTITEVNEKFKNVELNHLSVNSSIFVELSNIVEKYMTSTSVLLFFNGFVYGITTMLFFALVVYLFMIAFIKAGNYMKKSQLYKMLVFATTSLILVNIINTLFPLPTIIYFVLLFLGFIPLYILEREILLRIRMKIIGDGIIKSKSFMDKLNDILSVNNNDNDNDESNDDNVDYDSDEED